MSINNLSISKKLLINSAVPLCLFIALGGVLWASIIELHSASKMVVHTHKVIENTQGMINSMVDQETGLRGYVVGGQKEFLEPYFQGGNRYTAYYNTAKNLTSDNDIQQQRLNEIQLLVTQWQNYAQSLISLREEVEKGESVHRELMALTGSGIGKKYMDEIRGVIANNASPEQANRIIIAMINMETGLRGFVLNKKTEYLEPYSQGKSDIKDAIASLENNTEATAKINNWINNYAEKAIDLGNESNKYKSIDDVYAKFAQKQGKQYMDKIRDIISSIINEERELMIVREAASSESSSQTINFSLFGFTLVSIVSILISVFTSRGIINPIKKALSFSESIASGNLNAGLKTNRKGNHEISKLFTGLQKIATEMRTIVTKISHTSGDLVGTSNEIKDITALSKNDSNEQLKMAEQIEVAMSQMLEAIQEVSQSASTAANLANQVESETSEGKKTITSSIGSINKLEEEISVTSTKLIGLAKQASDIDSILDVIRDISDQTNLLALNAAIEAARAGEQGRGFAVVADEVRTLAKRTQGSTEEIQSLIENLQKETNGAVTTMQSSQEIVKSSVLEVSQSVEMFNNISEKIQSINNMNIQIASATEEQTATATEINNTISHTNNITKESFKKINDTVESSEKLSSNVTNLNAIIRFFKL